MEKFRQQENKKELTLQDKLKESLLDGDIKSFEEFADKLNKIEQRGTHVENSEANIHLLEDTEVYDKLMSFAPQGEEYQKYFDASYKGLLAVSYFHKGQKDLNDEDFRKAFVLANQSGYIPDVPEIQEFDPEILEEKKQEHEAWLKYIEGTLAYLDEDKDKLSQIITEIPEVKGFEVNTEILKRFLESLEQGENPKENYYQRYNPPKEDENNSY